MAKREITEKEAEQKEKVGYACGYGVDGTIKSWEKCNKEDDPAKYYCRDISYDKEKHCSPKFIKLNKNQLAPK